MTIREITILWGKKFPHKIEMGRDIPSFLDEVENAAWKVLESYGIQRQDQPPPPWPTNEQPSDAYIAQRILENVFFARKRLKAGNAEATSYNVSRIRDFLHASNNASLEQTLKAKKPRQSTAKKIAQEIFFSAFDKNKKPLQAKSLNKLLEAKDIEVNLNTVKNWVTEFKNIYKSR